METKKKGNARWRTNAVIDKKLWEKFKKFAARKGMTLEHAHTMAIKKLMEVEE